MKELREVRDKVGRELRKRKSGKKAVNLISKLEVLKRLAETGKGLQPGSRRSKKLNKLVSEAGEKRKALVGKLEFASIKLPEKLTEESVPGEESTTSPSESKPAEIAEQTPILYKPLAGGDGGGGGGKPVSSSPASPITAPRPPTPSQSSTPTPSQPPMLSQSPPPTPPTATTPPQSKPAG